MLIDREIRAALEAGTLRVSPDDGIDTRIQPASLDVRLGHTFLTIDTRQVAVIDPKLNQADAWVSHDVEAGDAFTLHPYELALAATLESIELSQELLARVEGKSSLGRLGLLVHATAGYVDPGWPLASITLEISCQIGVPILLYPGMPIAQLAFEHVAPVSAAYTGKYVGQDGPTPSRFYKNWTGTRWI